MYGLLDGSPFASTKAVLWGDKGLPAGAHAAKHGGTAAGSSAPQTKHNDAGSNRI